jgi:hypothetical protein
MEDRHEESDNETTESDSDNAITVQSEEQTRRREIIAAMDTIPKGINFNDGCILLNLLHHIWKQIRSADDTPNEFRDFWDSFGVRYNLDSNGRFTYLILGFNGFIYENEYSYNLPPIIECLTQLKHIKLRNCKLIPKELSNLQFLENLNLMSCPDILFRQNILEEIQLSSLTTISLSPQMFSLIKNRLPILKTLNLYERYCSMEDTGRRIVHAFQNDFCFQNSLSRLQLSGRKLKDEDLGTLLLDLVLKFPNLKELDLGKIESLTGIERIILKKLSSGAVILKNCLTRLDLRYGTSINQHIKKRKDPKEKAALLTILNTFNGISSIGTCYGNVHGCSSDVEYLLRINHAGRKYITGGSEVEASVVTTETEVVTTGGGSNDNKELSSSRTKPIPPQLWPKILERSYKQSGFFRSRKKCATGMFYLIRNGSILQDIIAMRQQQQQQHNSNGRAANVTSSSSDEADKRGQKRRLEEGLQK